MVQQIDYLSKEVHAKMKQHTGQDASSVVVINPVHHNTRWEKGYHKVYEVNKGIVHQVILISPSDKKQRKMPQSPKGPNMMLDLTQLYRFSK